jgi:hypothetical protein
VHQHGLRVCTGPYGETLESPIVRQLDSLTEASMRTSRPHEHRQGLEAIETQGKQLHELTPHHDLNLMMYHCRSSNCMIRDCPGTIALAYKITSHYPIVSTIVPCVNTAARPHGEGKQNDYKDVVLSSRYIVTRSWPCNVCIWKHNELCISKPVPKSCLILPVAQPRTANSRTTQDLASIFGVLTRSATCPIQTSASISLQEQSLASSLVRYQGMTTSMPYPRRDLSCRTRSTFRRHDRTIISVIPKVLRASCDTIHTIIQWQYASQSILHVVILV